VQDDGQSRVSHAEVMTVPLVAALFHRSNHALTRRALFEQGYIKVNLSASRFCRRLRAIPEGAWQMVFGLLSQVFVQGNTSRDYAVDSMPVLVCQNVRINRCRLFSKREHESLRGYQSSKKRYFWGFKVHLLVTRQGEPVEFFISEGSLHDLEGLRRLPLDLPAKSTIYGDKAYFDSKEEILVSEAGEIRLVALRRKNAKVPLPPELVALCHTVRQQVESAFSVISQTLPHKLHAVAPQGFLLKLNALVIAYSFACFVK
jgi:IS5 family transposase